MTKEYTELLLKDLCSRLLYGVKIHTSTCAVQKLKSIEYNVTWWVNGRSEIEEVNPYLRPMSSMTDKETELFNSDFGGITNGYNSIEIKRIDWLNQHHFDYRGLIEKGLAIAVTKENNPYENNL